VCGAVVVSSGLPGRREYFFIYHDYCLIAYIYSRDTYGHQDTKDSNVVVLIGEAGSLIMMFLLIF